MYLERKQRFMSNTLLRTGNPQAPYAESIALPAEAKLVYVSGILADVADGDAVPGTPAAYGDTQTQAASVLGKIQAILAEHDLQMRHIVQLRAFLVGTPEHGGRLDFAGFQRAYATFFDDPDLAAKPTRTAIQVVALPLPGTLVEVDVVAAHP